MASRTLSSFMQRFVTLHDTDGAGGTPKLTAKLQAQYSATTQWPATLYRKTAGARTFVDHAKRVFHPDNFRNSSPFACAEWVESPEEQTKGSLSPSERSARKLHRALLLKTSLVMPLLLDGYYIYCFITVAGLPEAIPVRDLARFHYASELLPAASKRGWSHYDSSDHQLLDYFDFGGTAHEYPIDIRMAISRATARSRGGGSAKQDAQDEENDEQEEEAAAPLPPPPPVHRRRSRPAAAAAAAQEEKSTAAAAVVDILAAEETEVRQRRAAAKEKKRRERQRRAHQEAIQTNVRITVSGSIEGRPQPDFVPIPPLPSADSAASEEEGEEIAHGVIDAPPPPLPPPAVVVQHEGSKKQRTRPKKTAAAAAAVSAATPPTQSTTAPIDFESQEAFAAWLAEKTSSGELCVIPAHATVFEYAPPSDVDNAALLAGVPAVPSHGSGLDTGPTPAFSWARVDHILADDTVAQLAALLAGDGTAGAVTPALYECLTLVLVVNAKKTLLLDEALAQYMKKHGVVVSADTLAADRTALLAATEEPLACALAHTLTCFMLADLCAKFTNAQ